MSYAEELAHESLRLVLPDAEQIFRNFRPNWLRNSLTNMNLELDFYLPRLKVGIEIQGQHHYDDQSQITRDELKRQLSKRNNVFLIELSVVQITPSILRSKLMSVSRTQRIFIGLKPFDITWMKHAEKIAVYKRSMQLSYGNCQAIRPPIESKRKSIRQDVDMALGNALVVRFKHRGQSTLGRVVDIQPGNAKLKARVLGSTEIVYMKKKDVLIEK